MTNYAEGHYENVVYEVYKVAFIKKHFPLPTRLGPLSFAIRT